MHRGDIGIEDGVHEEGVNGEDAQFYDTNDSFNFEEELPFNEELPETEEATTTLEEEATTLLFAGSRLTSLGATLILLNLC